MKLIIAILLALQIQFVPGTLYSIHDNIASFETQTGDIYECYYTDSIPQAGNYILIFIGNKLVDYELENFSSSFY